MALTEAEVIEALLLLRLPASEGGEVFYGPQEGLMVRARVAREQLEALTGARETKARALLDAYAPLANDTDRLNAQGLDSSAERTVSSLRADMRLLLGLPPGSSGSIKIARG